MHMHREIFITGLLLLLISCQKKVVDHSSVDGKTKQEYKTSKALTIDEMKDVQLELLKELERGAGDKFFQIEGRAEFLSSLSYTNGFADSSISNRTVFELIQKALDAKGRVDIIFRSSHKGDCKTTEWDQMYGSDDGSDGKTNCTINLKRSYYNLACNCYNGKKVVLERFSTHNGNDAYFECPKIADE